jgi:hypothetical protein
VTRVDICSLVSSLPLKQTLDQRIFLIKLYVNYCYFFLSTLQLTHPPPSLSLFLVADFSMGSVRSWSRTHTKLKSPQQPCTRVARCTQMMLFQTIDQKLQKQTKIPNAPECAARKVPSKINDIFGLYLSTLSCLSDRPSIRSLLECCSRRRPLSLSLSSYSDIARFISMINPTCRERATRYPTS